jgi:biopolymer transport protein ExbD
VPKVNSSDSPAAGRHGRGRRVATSLSEINVVPMVDVMLVLLIIFMVAAPMIQRGLDVNLPVARNAQQMTGDRIEIMVPASYRQDHIVFLGREAVRAAVLQERIRQKMEAAVKKEVFLGGDGRVNLNELMEVFSMLKAAGVEKIGIETKPGER